MLNRENANLRYRPNEKKFAYKKFTKLYIPDLIIFRRISDKEMYSEISLKEWD